MVKKVMLRLERARVLVGIKRINFENGVFILKLHQMFSVFQISLAWKDGVVLSVRAPNLMINRACFERVPWSEDRVLW